jgi:hypothetical protein
MATYRANPGIKNIDALKTALDQAGYELEDIGFSIRSDDRVDVHIKDTEDMAVAEAIVNDFFDPPIPYTELRLSAYRQAWTSDQFQEAILEYHQGDSTKLDELIALRTAIKADMPKPQN